MKNEHEILRRAFSSHSRRWHEFRYVYPVVSRRSGGVSIGVNLAPDHACNFNCVYCQVTRDEPAAAAEPVDLPRLEEELVRLLEMRAGIFDSAEFRDIPGRYKVIRDIAFSGDGEPTLSPAFPAAARAVAGVRSRFGMDQTALVLITNAFVLTRPEIVETLAYLDGHGLEIWAKLDAGTEEHFRRVNRCRGTLEDVTASILATARVRPIVIQSMFLQLHGIRPPEREIAAYLDRLGALLQNGARIRKVQLYTVARRTSEPYVEAIALTDLERIAAGVRELGIAAECYD